MWKEQSSVDEEKIANEVESILQGKQKGKTYYIRLGVIILILLGVLMLGIVLFLKNPTIAFNREKAFCTFEKGIVCKDNKILPESINLTLVNYMNENIDIYSILIGECRKEFVGSLALEYEKEVETEIPCNTSSFYKEQIRMEYKKITYGTLQKTHKGTVYYGIDYHGIERAYAEIWVNVDSVLRKK